MHGTLDENVPPNLTLLLADALINAARTDGYRLMRLDTGSLMTEAIDMYRKLGFRDCAPHCDYPETLLPYLVFMELPLRK